MSTDPYVLRVNGKNHEVFDAHLGESLLWVLRERLGLPGSKNACEEGECGSCSVQVDGELVCSCLVLAVAAVGLEVTTIEGLAPDGELADVQRAYVEAGAEQCGFCTPGLLMAVDLLLDDLPDDSDPDDLIIREAISGNLCRCTGYGRILEAVSIAADLRRGNRT